MRWTAEAARKAGTWTMKRWTAVRSAADVPETGRRLFRRTRPAVVLRSCQIGRLWGSVQTLKSSTSGCFMDLYFESCTSCTRPYRATRRCSCSPTVTAGKTAVAVMACTTAAASPCWTGNWNSWSAPFCPCCQMTTAVGQQVLGNGVQVPVNTYNTVDTKQEVNEVAHSMQGVGRDRAGDGDDPQRAVKLYITTLYSNYSI